MEHIVAFLPGQFSREDLFCVEMAGITYPDSRYRIEREYSNIYCLEYVISGQGVIDTSEKTFSPREGDVYLLCPGKKQVYYSDPAKPWEKIWMNLRGSLCKGLVESYGLGEQVLFPQCPAYPLFREFLSLCEKEKSRIPVLEKEAPLLFHKILQTVSQTTGPRPPEQPAAALIREHLDRQIYGRLSIPQLAKQVNLSPSQLTRVFKKAFGQTPYDYLLSRKIEAACLLLKNTGMSVKETAYRLHFTDEHYFSNVFRQRMGVPPGKYRNG